MDVAAASEIAVAVGTGALAVATYRLVQRTAELGEQTKRDVEGQFLPVVLSDRYTASGGHFPENQQTGDGPWITTLDVAVENVGRGPALDVHLHVPGTLRFEYNLPISLGPDGHAEVGAAIRDDDPIEALLPFDVHVRYRSIGHIWYATRMTAALRKGPSDEPVYVWGVQYLGQVALPDDYAPMARFRPD
jgi:hypothetical protein